MVTSGGSGARFFAHLLTRPHPRSPFRGVPPPGPAPRVAAPRGPWCLSGGMAHSPARMSPSSTAAARGASPPSSPVAVQARSPRLGAAQAVAGDAPAAPKILRLAAVGDVHGQWDDADETALASLGADLALFVGDFGEENVPLVQKIAAVDHRKAVILGNHDAWYTATTGGVARRERRRAQGVAAFADPSGGKDSVKRQLDALGRSHVGYGAMQCKDLGLTVLGGRPFSRGGGPAGGRWEQERDFLEATYGVRDHDASAKKMLTTYLEQPLDAPVVLLAHNGPSGMGTMHHSICGKDFDPDGGDWGDPDAEMLLDRLGESPDLGRRWCPLMVFGHMHGTLQKGRGERRMVEIHRASGTVLLNTAVVPRHRKPQDVSESAAAAVEATGRAEALAGSVLRNFTVVELRDSVVTKIEQVWVAVWEARSDDGNGGSGGDAGASVVARVPLLSLQGVSPGQATGEPARGLQAGPRGTADYHVWCCNNSEWEVTTGSVPAHVAARAPQTA